MISSAWYTQAAVENGNLSLVMTLVLSPGVVIRSLLFLLSMLAGFNVAWV